MEELHIDLYKARELVSQAIEERGEGYVYKQSTGVCLYVHDTETYNPDREQWEIDFSVGTPGCLVGAALMKGGVRPEAFASFNDRNSSEALARLQADGVLTYTLAAEVYLGRAQACQDEGWAWGEARRQAEDSL